MISINIKSVPAWEDTQLLVVRPRGSRKAAENIDFGISAVKGRPALADYTGEGFAILFSSRAEFIKFLADSGFVVVRVEGQPGTAQAWDE